MNIEKLRLTKCRVIDKLSVVTFLVEDLLDNKEKEMKQSGKQAQNFILKEDEIVYAIYSINSKAILRFCSGIDFKRRVSNEIYDQKEILDKYLPIKAKYA